MAEVIAHVGGDHHDHRGDEVSHLVVDVATAGHQFTGEVGMSHHMRMGMGNFLLL